MEEQIRDLVSDFRTVLMKVVLIMKITIAFK